MKILNLHLENFRGIKTLDIDFAGKDTDIYGTNGTGKTTIANAISWLIVDAPITGEKDFSPKTADSHNLHHKAEMKVETKYGAQVTFTKDFYELWQKKRGSSAPEFSGHTTDYYKDGVPVKKKDYEAEMEMACGTTLDNVKMLLILGYFSETMKPEARRKILFDVCGDVSDEYVLKLPAFEYLKTALIIPGTDNQQYDVEELKKIKTKARQGYNKDLTAIPERIDELTKQMTAEDEDVLEEEQIKASISELMDKRSKLLAQSKDDSKEQYLRKLRNELSDKKLQYQKDNAKANEKAEETISTLRATLRGIDEDIDDKVRKQRELNNRREDMISKRENLMLEFTEVKSRKCEIDTNCPTCGQPLPESRLQVARKAWEDNRIAEIKDIQHRGQACSKDKIQELETACSRIKDEINVLSNRANELSAQIKEAGRAIRHFPPFEETKEYISLCNQIKAAESAECVTDGDLKQELVEIDRLLAEREGQLAQIKVNQNMKCRIAELEAQQKETAAALEDVEHIIVLCEEFTRAKASMITDNVNKRFKTISFRLFREQINGGLKECCEALIPNKDGLLIEYRSANTAAKVNAGLEIVEVLNNHFAVNLPVIVDGAESVCHTADMPQQMIKLIVSAEDETISVKRVED